MYQESGQYNLDCWEELILLVLLLQLPLFPSSNVISLHYRGNTTESYLRVIYLLLILYYILTGCLDILSNFYVFYNIVAYLEK